MLIIIMVCALHCASQPTSIAIKGDSQCAYPHYYSGTLVKQLQGRVYPVSKQAYSVSKKVEFLLFIVNTSKTKRITPSSHKYIYLTNPNLHFIIYILLILTITVTLTYLLILINMPYILVTIRSLDPRLLL